MNTHLFPIAEQFRTTGEVTRIKSLGEGFINDTYVAETADRDGFDYLLQRKNKHVFRDIPGMMDNILKVTTHLKKKIVEKNGDHHRESLTLIETGSGELFTTDADGEYWTMCLLIKDHVLFENAETAALAEAGGRGIGKFQRMLADFKKPLADTLPGYHNMRFRFTQWDDVLSRDPAGRKKMAGPEISRIENRRKEMMGFWQLVESGQIPGRITHNDTKISNILFDKNHDALCIIDLDTVSRSTVLNDFGDAIRSYANTGLEDERDLNRVGMDMQKFEAFTRGYLSQARSFLSAIETEHLAFSALYITFEQALRFLMDYMDGDKYYRTQFTDHNLIRARAQYKLLQEMEGNYSRMKKIVAGLAAE